MAIEEPVLDSRINLVGVSKKAILSQDAQLGSRLASLSTRLFGIDWTRHFPFSLPNGESVHYSTSSICLDFFNSTQSEFKVFSPPEVGFVDEPFTTAKLKYYEEVGDFFAFMDGSKIIGFFIGTPIDWNSYYLRFVWIIPEYQGGGRYQLFLKYLLDVLQSNGVARAHGDVPPSNLGHLHVFNKLKFNVTGMHVSERWGAVMQVTRFLGQENESVFLRKFCRGVKPQLNGS